MQKDKKPVGNKKVIFSRPQIKILVDNLQIVLQMLANLAVIIGVVFVIVQIKDFRAGKSTDLVLIFGEYLDDEPYLSISETLDTEDPTVKLFQPEGKFTVGDIDRYLGTFETLGNLYREDLITCEMLKTDFSYYIKKAYSNEDIKNYIKESKDSGNYWWQNFILLGELFSDDKGC